MLASPKLPPLNPTKSQSLLSPAAQRRSIRHIRDCVALKEHISLDHFFSPQHSPVSSLPSSPVLRPAKRQLRPIDPSVLQAGTLDTRILVGRAKESKHRQVLRALKDIRTYLPPVLLGNLEEARGQRQRFLSFS